MRTHSTSDAARLAAVFTGCLLVASVPVALAADASGPAPPTAPLRALDTSLETRASAATLELYALEAELGRARSEAESIAARQAVVERERVAARNRLVVARNAVRISEARLADLVRALYEHSGASDPLAILLGAESLEEALTGLDSLDRAAGQNARIIEQARSSRRTLGKLDGRLAAQAAELARLGAAADARARTLASVAETRKRFVAGLRHQQGLNAARVATIEAQAHTAEARTTAIADTTPVTTAAPAIATSGQTITVSSTGYSLRGRTATGIPTGPGVVAVDPSVIPLGTRMTIPGYGEAVAADTGGAVYGATIDLWFATNAEALQWGRRTVTITIH